MNFLFNSRRICMLVITLSAILQFVQLSSAAPVHNIPRNFSYFTNSSIPPSEAFTPITFTTLIPSATLTLSPTSVSVPANSSSTLESIQIVTTTLVEHHWIAVPITVTTTISATPTGIHYVTANNTATITVTASIEGETRYVTTNNTATVTVTASAAGETQFITTSNTATVTVTEPVTSTASMINFLPIPGITNTPSIDTTSIDSTTKSMDPTTSIDPTTTSTISTSTDPATSSDSGLKSSTLLRITASFGIRMTSTAAPKPTDLEANTFTVSFTKASD